MKKLVVGFLLFCSTALHGITYKVFDLPALGGSTTTTTGAYDISENGWVAGYSGTRAVRWQATLGGALPPTNLGVISPATTSKAYGVNDSGHVVGVSGIQAFIWIPEISPALQPIPPPAGAPSSAKCIAAYGVNHVDEVVGTFSMSTTGSGYLMPLWAFRWAPEEGTTLYPSPYYTRSIGSAAFAINNFGQFVGKVEMPPSGSAMAAQQAFSWEPPNSNLLGALPGPDDGPGSSVAYGVNGLAHVVGESEGLACLWQPPFSMAPIAIGTARGINNYDVIVGHASSNYAWVKFPNAIAQDLNGLIPANSGWTLLEAHGINDRGWIVGIGRKTVATTGGGLSGDETSTVTVLRGFLLIPV
jgi:hypothetical protein